MKKHITILLLLALTVSCTDAKKNKTSGDTKISQTKSDTYLKATVDGATFYIENPSYNFISAKKLISLSAISKDKNETIRISIAYNKGPATYTLGMDSGSMIYTNNKVHWIASKLRGEGSITLTEEGNYLIGKFSFTAADNEIKKQITNGEFKVKNK